MPSSGARTDGEGGPRGGLQEQFWVKASDGERVEAMRLYFAGNVKPSANDDAHAVCYADGVRSRLQTFADIDDWAREGFRYWVEDAPPRDVSVFLDSGAFGAFMRGAKLDLGRYCDYIAEHKQALDCYAALDVIGDWEGTKANTDAMVARGLRPIPTYHRGSPWHALDRIAAEFPYIAIGGLAADTSRPGQRPSFSQANIQPFMDEVFLRLERHWPVKVHAFGMISQWALERYPLYSADSATAIVGAGMGRVSRFRRGLLQSSPWFPDDLERTWDGAVADGVGRAGGSAHAGRRRRNIEAVLALEQEMTDLWTAKGVAWS